MNKWCSIKSEKQPEWNLVLQWTDGANASGTFYRAANERSSLTSDSLSVSPTQPSCRYTNIAHYDRFNVLHTAADPPPASGRPLFLISVPLMTSYQCCSKLHQLWGAVGTSSHLYQRFFFVCQDYTAPALLFLRFPLLLYLQIAPSINSISWMFFFFCLRMHIG